MALNDHEARALADLERQLAADDPALARQLGDRHTLAARLRTWQLRTIAGLGLAAMPASIVIDLLPVGIAGFAVAAVAGIPLAERALPTLRAWQQRWRQITPYEPNPSGGGGGYSL